MHARRTVALVLTLAAQLCRAEDLLAGRAFTDQLRLEQPADELLFRATGAERAEALLTNLMEKGQSSGATAEDWTYLHRAIAGLIELAVFRGNLGQAATYCGLQQMYYRILEHDYASALAAARQGLALQAQSPQPQLQYIHQKNIGENLLKLGRAIEAAATLEESLRANPDPLGATAAVTWRVRIEALIASPDDIAAQRTVDHFLATAVGAPKTFQGHAQLANAVWRIHREQFPDALDALRRAALVIKDDPRSVSFQFEIATQVLQCLLAAIGTLPFEETVTLADQIGRDFQDLPLPLDSLTQGAIRMRRRLAGDIEGVLREDTLRLARARAEAAPSRQTEALRSLAASYRALNAGREEITVLEQARDIEKLLDPAPSYNYLADVLSLGDAYLRAHDLGKARQAFDEVAKAIHSAPDMNSRQQIERLYGPALLGKAGVLEQDEDLDEARSILEKAAKDARFDRAIVWRQWGRLEASAMERPARAAELLRAAAMEFAAQRQTQAELYARLELAQFLSTSGRPLPQSAHDAEKELATARDLAVSSRVADALWRAAYVAGLLAQGAQNNPAAIAHFRNAAGLLDNLRAGISQQDQRQSFMDNAAAEDLYRRLISLLLAAGKETEAWQFLERSKARSFVEMMHGRRFRAAAASSPEFDQAERKLIALRVAAAPEIQQALRGSGKDATALHAEIRAAQDRLTLLRQQANLSRSRDTESLSLRPIDWASVQRALPPATALIEYVILGDSIAAFIVTSTGHRSVAWKTNPVPLRRDVLRLRGLLADPGSTADLPVLLDAVSRAVIAPVMKDLPAEIRDLVIVPAAFLHYLPFQVLPLDQTGTLIERYTVSYLPSASTLPYLNLRRKPPSDLFVGALGNVAVEGWAPLPGTLTELADIHKVAPQSQTVSGPGFTHNALVRGLEQHAEVHVATHGLLDEQAPLFSALLTNPAPGQPSRLSLYEFTRLRLRARLVVLSACETGLGKLLAGDEVAGLTRTFLQAGADTVVASLWKVSDDSTALLMATFHQRRRGGEGPARALRGAALAVREKFPHPFYWAPFVVTGAR